MQTSDSGLLFQSTRQLDDAQRRERKVKAAEHLGSPIRVSGKILDLKVRWPEAWTAESGWVARQLDLRCRTTKRLFKGHRGPVTSVELLRTSLGETSPLLLFTASWDKTIRVWDVESGAQLHVLEAHSDFVKSLLAIPPARLISTSSDRTFRCWDLSPMSRGSLPIACAAIRSHTRPVECATFRECPRSGDTSLWTGDSLGVIIEWKLDGCAATMRKSLSGHETSVTALATDDDGIWSASMDMTVKFHPYDCSPTITLPQTGYVKSTCPMILNQIHVVLTGGDDEDIWVWASGTDSQAPLAKVPGHCGEISVIQPINVANEDGWVVVSGSLDGTIRMWTAQDLLHPRALNYSSKPETSTMTEDEERELAELLEGD